MENTTLYKIIIAVVLLAFWFYGSGTLTINPNLTLAIIPFSFGMLTVISIVIQLVLKESVQKKMKEVLDTEIEKRRGELIGKLKDLVTYLEETKYPSYSDSGVEGLDSAFHEFDSIKSRYTSQPKIIYSTILIVLSSLILFLFWANPTLWVYQAEGGGETTLAHAGLGLLAVGLWIILDILATSLETKFWEKD